MNKKTKKPKTQKEKDLNLIKQKDKIISIAMCISIILALIGFSELAVQYKIKQEVIEKTQEVLVLTKEIKPGEEFNSSNTEVAKANKGVVPENCVYDFKGNNTSNGEYKKGTIITAGMIAEKPSAPSLGRALPAGKVGMPISIDAINGLVGFIGCGDYVTVMSTEDSSIIAKDVRVVALDQKFDAPCGTQFSSIVLELSQSEVDKVLESKGSIRLTKNSTVDVPEETYQLEAAANNY